MKKQTGAILTAKIGHKLFEVTGIRHTRHAKKVETILQKQKGILEASVTETGLIRVEFDTGEINQDTILKILSKQKLTIKATDDHVHEEEHDHEHGGIFGEKTELVFSITGGVLLGLGFGLSYIDGIHHDISLYFYIGAYFFGGFFLAKEAAETMFKGGFEIDFLMLVAAVGAAIIGEWPEGAFLLFLFGIGHSLEHYAMAKQKNQ